MSDVAPTLNPSAADTKPDRLRLILRAFRSRNYRLFFGGQLVSMVGNFLTMVATAWLVYRLARDGPHPERAPLLLGIVGFAGQLPMFFLSPFAGVWVDRVSRRKLLVITQTIAMLQSFALAVLAFTHFNIAQIIALSLVQGVVNAFDIPGRQAFLVEIVDRRDDLPNAIALNSTMVHGARIVGPALAGLLIPRVGAGVCFLLDGISYIGVIVALLMMTVKPRPRREDGRSMRQEFVEGFRYVWGFAPIRVLLMLMAVMSLTAMPALMVLMPIFGDALAGTSGGAEHGAQTMGILMSASGGGALVGAIYLAARRSVVGLGNVIVVAGVVFGVALMSFGAVHHLWLALLIIPFAGFGMIANFASANTVLQTLTEEDKRGRVMSFFTMAFVGMIPFGNLLVGSLAHTLSPNDPVTGARRAVILAGGCSVIATVIFATKLPGLRKIVRPIYVKKGIISEVASGMSSAAQIAQPE